jgi:site-specific recombinase XerD
MLHVHQGKGSKDRCVPLGTMLPRAIKNYLAAFNPIKYLFENQEGVMVSVPYIAGTIRTAAHKAGITKPVHAHGLRHTYASHLSEQGIGITTIQSLLGHKRLQTTLIYLHVTQPVDNKACSPLDAIYDQR